MGDTVLSKAGLSTFKVVKLVYELHPWNRLKFRVFHKEGNIKPKKPLYWDNKENQRLFLENLGKKLGVSCMKDWKAVTYYQIRENGGGRLLETFGGLTSKLISSVFVEHPLWLDQSFCSRSRVYPKDYWDNQANRIALMKQLSSQLEIEELEDWYRVSLSQIRRQFKYMTVFKRHPLKSLLPDTFPNHNWDVYKLVFRNGLKATQRQLKMTVKQLFPTSGNFFKHSD